MKSINEIRRFFGESKIEDAKNEVQADMQRIQDDVDKHKLLKLMEHIGLGRKLNDDTYKMCEIMRWHRLHYEIALSEFGIITHTESRQKRYDVERAKMIMEIK